MLKVGRGAHAPPFMVMDVIAAANARQAALPPGSPHVIRMEVGQPGTGAPAGAVAAAAAALRRADPLGYTEAFGRPSLRARIAAHYRDWYGLELSPARIAVTMGASGAFPLAFLAAFDPGDRVALAAPFYPPYVNILTALGLEPVIIETGPADALPADRRPLLERLDPPPGRADRRQPLQPGRHHAGARTSCRRSPAGATRNGVRLISDEIYHGLHYARPIATAAAFSDSAIVINSFSKYFSMTGWRVGWMVLPADLLRPVECLAQNLFISRPAYRAGRGGGGVRLHAELEANVARYRRSRDHLLAALPAAGFPDIAAAEGAFYLYADVGRPDQRQPGVLRAHAGRGRAWRRARASISTAPAATGRCGSAIAGRRPTWRRRRRGSSGGGNGRDAPSARRRR